MIRSTRCLLATLCAVVGLLSPILPERVATAAPVTTSYSSGPLNRPIPDLGFIEQPIQVNDAGPILDVNARVRINHTYDEDLNLYLIGPDGTTVELSFGNGEDGENYGSGPTNCSGTFTTFDDQAGTSIVNGTAPFAGTFRPEESLAAFNGKSSAGQWRLRVEDDQSGDTGTLFCWEFQITREVAPPPPQADLSIQLIDAPDPVRAGTNLSHTLTVANNGPSASAATTSLTLPAGVTFVSATPARGPARRTPTS